MTSELSAIDARVREFIQLSAEQTPADDALFGRLALELFEAQYAGIPPYRRFCDARTATPGRVGHWSQVPAIPTAAFKELELTSIPSAARTSVFHSSGTTTQRPSRHYHSGPSLGLYDDSLWAWFKAHVLPGLGIPGPNSSAADSPSQAGQNPTPEGWRLVALTPSPSQAPHSSLAHMFETVRRRAAPARASFVGTIGAEGSWVLDSRAAAAELRDAENARQPVLLLGTAFSFVHLLDSLAEHRVEFALPRGSRAMETGGYKGRSRSMPREELHSRIARRLGIPGECIVSEYGMSELSSQAYDSTANSGQRAFRFPPWARAQVISPETGREVAENETGLIRVFDLANVYSVMAVQTEDAGTRRADAVELLGRSAIAEPRGCSLMSV